MQANVMRIQGPDSVGNPVAVDSLPLPASAAGRSRAEYFAIDAVSHSALEVFRQSIPEYHATYISKTLERAEPTAAMSLGTALHCRVLTPERWDDEIALTVDFDKRTIAGKKAWGEFSLAAAGKTVITTSQMAVVQRMAVAVLANSEVLSCGLAEDPRQWVHDETGLACKGLLDYHVAGKYIVDVKTAADPTPEAFARQAANYGYFRQAAFYNYRREITGGLLPFFFVVVGTAPPHECIVYEVEEHSMSVARDQNDRLMRELRECLDFNSWGSRWAKTQSLTMPRWAAE